MISTIVSTDLGNLLQLYDEILHCSAKRGKNEDLEVSREGYLN